MKRKTNVEISSNLLEYKEKEKQEAVDYLFSVIDSIIEPQGYDPRTQYGWVVTKVQQVKELVKLAEIGKEEPRWLDRIKKLEAQLSKIRNVAEGCDW